MSTDALKQKLSLAKTALVVDNAFIASLICSQKVAWDDKLDPPTMVTDGHTLIVCPAHVESLSAQEMRWALANITMRLVFGCHLRSRVAQRDPLKWDVACDIVINGLLREEVRDGRSTVGTIWDGAIQHEGLYEKGKTIEGVYALLPDVLPFDGAGRQGVLIFNGSEAEQSEEAANLHRQIAQARDIARAAGTLSESMARFVGAELTPKVQWQDRLRSFFTKRARSDRSWARPSRRMIGQGFLMPSFDGEGMDDVIVAVDLSGSVTPDELQEFLTELRAIKTDCNPTVTHVIYFTSVVTKYESFGQDDELMLSPDGTGGTAFSPIFRYAREHDIEPACAVVLTDLYCGDFGPVPAYPVLWVSTGAPGPTPFGEVLMLREQSL
jgi:predicted metal-dependent peptidase